MCRTETFDLFFKALRYVCISLSPSPFICLSPAVFAFDCLAEQRKGGSEVFGCRLELAHSTLHYKLNERSSMTFTFLNAYVIIMFLKFIFLCDRSS